MKLYLIYGGNSVEHDVSILSAFSISEALDYKKYEVIPVYLTKDGKFIQGPVLTETPTNREKLRLTASSDAQISSDDTVSSTGVIVQPSDFATEDAVAFPVIHGTNGEDGTIQGMFDILNIPYVGNGVLASSTAMDKIVSKIIFDAAKLPQVNYVPVLRSEWQKDAKAIVTECVDNLSFPMYIKPANGGSSIGIEIARNENDLPKMINDAFEYDHRVLVEQGIVNVREFAVGVLGNDDFKISVAGEVLKDQEFYDYETKFVNGKIKLDIPAHIPEDISQKMKDYTATAFEAIDGAGLARFDYFLDEDNNIYLNELQTMPGFTQFSMYPFLWQASGISYPELIENLIECGVERFKEQKAIQDNY